MAFVYDRRVFVLIGSSVNCKCFVVNFSGRHLTTTRFASFTHYVVSFESGLCGTNASLRACPLILLLFLVAGPIFVARSSSMTIDEHLHCSYRNHKFLFLNLCFSCVNALISQPGQK